MTTAATHSLELERIVEGQEVSSTSQQRAMHTTQQAAYVFLGSGVTQFGTALLTYITAYATDASMSYHAGLGILSIVAYQFCKDRHDLIRDGVIDS